MPVKVSRRISASAENDGEVWAEDMARTLERLDAACTQAVGRS